MWEINLVKYRFKSLKRGKVAKLFLCGEAVLLLITLLLLYGLHYRISHQIERAQKELESAQENFILLSKNYTLEKKGGDVEEIKKQWKRLGENFSAINKIVQKRIIWSPKLQAIAESIPSTIYLRKIYDDKKTVDDKAVNILVIEGFVQASAEDALVHINEFTTRLENNALLKEQVSKIERPYVSKPKVTEDQKMFLHFKLFCYLNGKK